LSWKKNKKNIFKDFILFGGCNLHPFEMNGTDNTSGPNY
jgi:hypothetical protein